jgi:ribosomal protein L15
MMTRGFQQAHRAGRGESGLAARDGQVGVAIQARLVEVNPKIGTTNPTRTAEAGRHGHGRVDLDPIVGVRHARHRDHLAVHAERDDPDRDPSDQDDLGVNQRQLRTFAELRGQPGLLSSG